MCVVQWGMFVVGTVGLVAWVSGQEWFVSQGWIEKEVVRNPGTLVVLSCAAAMMFFCFAGIWTLGLARGELYSGVCAGMWGLCAGVLYAGATSGMGGTWETVRADAQAISEIAVPKLIPNVSNTSDLYVPPRPKVLVRAKDDVLEPEFVFYAAKAIERCSVKQLKEAGKTWLPSLVLVTKNEKNEQLMRDLGYEVWREFGDDSRKRREAWTLRK
jgi:hypothetical protein